jgi:hypothetical protein
MKCAKCGLDLPTGVKNCPKCGNVNEFAPEAPQRKKIKPIVYVIGVLVLIIAFSAVYAAVMAGRGDRNVTAAPGGATPPGNVVSAPPGEPSGGNVVSAPPGKPAGGDTGPTGVRKPKPPQDLVDYLDFVKKVEEHRQMLLKDTTDALLLSSSAGQAKSLINMIDMAGDPDGAEAQDPLADVKKELSRQYKNWLSTLTAFDGRTAPDSCREFSGAYRQVLFSESKTIGEIAGSFNKVDITSPDDMGKLLSALQKMKRDPSIQGGIDQAADNADARLTSLVEPYDMAKPFSVPREKQTSGNIMGF